jgi:hypothetical protein
MAGGDGRKKLRPEIAGAVAEGSEFCGEVRRIPESKAGKREVAGVDVGRDGKLINIPDSDCFFLILREPDLRHGGAELEADRRGRTGRCIFTGLLKLPP